MSTKKIVNQIVDHKTGHFVCLACGKTEDPNKLLPMPLEDFARFCEIFTELHTLKGCNNTSCIVPASKEQEEKYDNRFPDGDSNQYRSINEYRRNP